MHGLHCWSYGHHNLIINCSLLLITFLYMSELKKVKLKIKSLKKGTLIIFFSFFISLSYCTLFQCSSIIKQSITKSFPHLSHQRLTFQFCQRSTVSFWPFAFIILLSRNGPLLCNQPPHLNKNNSTIVHSSIYIHFFSTTNY
jgi:hypothetical protein